ncbi:MAG: hypothetical protein JNL25_13645 [Rhodospirillaceae bacterium]|nr:hypothetical protein [Rhodospirillaceae bacterium]
MLATTATEQNSQQNHNQFRAQEIPILEDRLAERAGTGICTVRNAATGVIGKSFPWFPGERSWRVIQARFPESRSDKACRNRQWNLVRIAGKFGKSRKKCTLVS